MHVTPILGSLNRLSNDFKVWLLVYKTQKGLGPEYITIYDSLKEYKPSSSLRSMGAGQMVVRKTQCKHIEATFSIHAAQK